MNIADKVVNLAKKGFDWATFSDGISVQQEYFYQAIDIESKALQEDVFWHTARKWTECAGIQTAGYFALSIIENHSHQSLAFNTYFCIIGTIGIEALRYKLRTDYFAKSKEQFNSQISQNLVIFDNVIPPQVNQISSDELKPYEKDSDSWKYGE